MDDVTEEYTDVIYETIVFTSFEKTTFLQQYVLNRAVVATTASAAAKLLMKPSLPSTPL